MKISIIRAYVCQYYVTFFIPYGKYVITCHPSKFPPCNFPHWWYNYTSFSVSSPFPFVCLYDRNSTRARDFKHLL